MVAFRKTHTIARQTGRTDDEIIAMLSEQHSGARFVTEPMFALAFEQGASDKLLAKLAAKYLTLMPSNGSHLPCKVLGLPYIASLRKFGVKDHKIAGLVSDLCCDQNSGWLHREGFWASDEAITVFGDKPSLDVLLSNMIVSTPTLNYTEERVGKVRARMVELGIAEQDISKSLNEFQDVARRHLHGFHSRFQAEAMLLAADNQMASCILDLSVKRCWNLFVIGMSLSSEWALPLIALRLRREIARCPERAPRIFAWLEAGFEAMNTHILGDLDRSVFPKMVDSLADLESVRDFFASCGHSIVPLEVDVQRGLCARLEINGHQCIFVFEGAASEGDYVMVAHTLIDALEPRGEQRVVRAELPLAAAAVDEAQE